MSLKRTVRRKQLQASRRENAEAYLRGEYPWWRLDIFERAWAHRLRKAQNARQTPGEKQPG